MNLLKSEQEKETLIIRVDNSYYKIPVTVQILRGWLPTVLVFDGKFYELTFEFVRHPTHDFIYFYYLLSEKNYLNLDLAEKQLFLTENLG
jgi:hypothetical protein